MTTSPTNFNFTELDFDNIRQSIVDYLKSQSEFQDVDFEGSAISYLVDALAYSQTYMAYHANMAVSETFLQSARLRENVVAKAKELGYTPHSFTAAKSSMRVIYDYPSHDSNNPETEFQIPRGTQFNSDTEKTFVTLEDYYLQNDEGTNDYIADIEIFEGELKSFSHTLSEGGPGEKIQIPSSNIDLNTLRVSLDGTPGFWVQSESIRNLGPNSAVYFVQEGPTGDYELYFGDDIIGKNPGSGQVINVEYLETSGPDGNGAITFEMNSPPSSFSGVGGSFSYENVTRSQNGAEREDIESIRHSAPLMYQSQDRGVTKDDYYSVLLNEFGYIEAVNVWGGEENDPPFYGRVFISIKPKTGDRLSAITKRVIEQRVKEKFSVMAITPVVVDADYIFVKPESTVTYIPAKTIQTKGQITGEIKNRVQDFFEANVSQFDDVLRYSRLANVIDETNEAISGNVTRFTLIKKFTPTPNRLVAYQMDFFNELEPGSIKSIPFTQSGSTVSFKDDGSGGITLFINGKSVRARVGTVDYKTGRVMLTRYVFRTSQNFEFSMTATPTNLDIKSKRNALIRYDSGHIVTMVDRADAE